MVTVLPRFQGVNMPTRARNTSRNPGPCMGKKLFSNRG